MRCSVEEPVNNIPANQADDYVKCPYFPEHELRRSRLPYHLIKCQKNPRAPKLLACPYNYLHRVRPDDIEDHVHLCEDRVMAKYVDRGSKSFATTLKKEFNMSTEDIAARKTIKVVDGTNNW